MKSYTGIASILVFLVYSISAHAQNERPNIVLIMSDYMGYADTEPYGATDISTPSLNRLAGEGVRMTDFYAAAPVCGPARAALLTGRYPARIGFESNIRTESDGIGNEHPTLAQHFNNAGYRTALYGKWHLGYKADSTPMAHGFEHFIGHHMWTIGYYHHMTENGEPGLYENDETIERDGYLTDLLTDEAVSFIERNRDEPFFLMLSYNAALPPYQPPGLSEEKWNEGWDVNKASREDYAAMVERMDEGIGRVLDSLDAHSLADNTLVIYLYDHGGRHLVNSYPLFNGFANLWEGGIRIPLLLRYPGRLPEGGTSGVPGIAMDVTATILSAAGLADAAAGLDGIDLVPFLSGTRTPPERRFFWRANFYGFGRQRAIREGNWKYIEHDSTQFLIDLDSDISERRNRFHEAPEVVNRLRARLDEWERDLTP